MNKVTAIVSTLFIIIATSCFLYWKGEKSLEKATEKFTVLAFENTGLNCNQNSLKFFIENNQKKEISYQVTIDSNGQILEKFTVLLPAQSEKKFKPQVKTIEEVCSKSVETRYNISIDNQPKNLSIYKLISI